MTYAILDNDELLRLALDAMNTGRDAESVVMLKTLTERDPGNAYGHYLLAAQHAQMGLIDRAEMGFRTAVNSGLEIPAARFQLGQLLLLKGENGEARQVLSGLQTEAGNALGDYAKALMALAEEDVVVGIGHLRNGLQQHQEIPALADDMRRLLASLEAQANEAESTAESTALAGASLLLSNYGRHH